jgi:hypothetical protein
LQNRRDILRERHARAGLPLLRRDRRRQERDTRQGRDKSSNTHGDPPIPEP